MMRDQDSAPACSRFAAMWDRMAAAIRKTFPTSPSSPSAHTTDASARVEAHRIEDAYNSLAIEGYQVTPELIRQVSLPGWNASVHSEAERPHALAARGYLNAFSMVRDALAGEISGARLASSYEGWHQALFLPLLESHGLKRSDIMGYRRHAVFLPHSRHVPASWETVPDLMRVYRAKLREETSPEVKAIMGHFGFGFIHPYQDGNGRVSRFIMNAALVEGRHPWTVIHVANRAEYLKTLEAASVHDDIEPFVRFVQKEMKATAKAGLPEVPRLTPPTPLSVPEKVGVRSIG